MIEGYVQSLPPDRRPLLERYNVLDCARKVVGVGSVGTRCYLSLLADADACSPIFLQLKEALDAVLAPHVGHSEFRPSRTARRDRPAAHAGRSDIFLGWTSYREHEYYVRQYRDMKGSVNLDAMTLSGLASYAQVCGRTLARAHARSGDAAMISGYMGRGTRFEDSVTASYADQVAEDHRTLVEAARSGRVNATPGL